MPPPEDEDPKELAEIFGAVGRGDRRRALDLAFSASQRGLDHPLILVLAAERLAEDGRAREAIALLRAATAAAADEPEGWRRLGDALARQDLLVEARQALETALDLAPDIYPTLVSAGAVCFRTGDLTPAEGFYRRAATLAPDKAEPLAALAAIAARRGDLGEARRLGERALALSPDAISAEMAIGRVELAERAPELTEARMSRLLDRPDLSGDQKVGLLDLRADARDALDRPADAFADYTRRNAILELANAARFAHETVERRVDQARRRTEYLTATAPEPWQAAGGQDREGALAVAGHVFLMGFPRSGTTLLEHVLATHPGAVSLEEFDHLGEAGGHLLANAAGLDHLASLPASEADTCRQAYWRGVRGTLGGALEGRVLIDKLPLHTLSLPLISRLFPDARILFALRDPRDVVLSCFRRRFQINAAMYEFLTLDGAARYYDQVMRLAGACRRLLPLAVREVRHEAMVADFDTEAREALAFIGLDWDPAVRGFAARGSGALRTPSDPQLARGLNAAGVGQWRRYARQMAPVLDILEPWARRFGYPPGPAPVRLAGAAAWGDGFRVAVSPRRSKAPG
jgi:tetratricopeptide (TPR) repeat protein